MEDGAEAAEVFKTQSPESALPEELLRKEFAGKDGGPPSM